ncbi:DUF1059 domain-containing protein [Ornithinimicrobium cavernae]|uniref:DUF1059 domain-containing protein n=1 Tax=Ornithinimicrobium cavernae TaxID=2666047 RepID=UPI00192A4080|nr:DUF1059 domain-containing protein [Ornithinimicrobium cavernae]
MPMEMNCRDLGFDCDGVVTGESSEDVLSQAAAHAQSVHAMTPEQVSDPSFVDQARSLIHEKA